MASFLSDEWFAAVLEAAEPLPSIDDLSFSFEIEVPESASGKVRGHGRVEAGRLVSLASGKSKDPVEVDFICKAKRALPIARGEVSALVAYMRGELKIDGAYELVVDRLANEADGDALRSFGERVAAITE